MTIKNTLFLLIAFFANASLMSMERAGKILQNLEGLQHAIYSEKYKGEKTDYFFTESPFLRNWDRCFYLSADQKKSELVYAEYIVKEVEEHFKDRIARNTPEAINRIKEDTVVFIVNGNFTKEPNVKKVLLDCFQS